MFALKNLIFRTKNLKEVIMENSCAIILAAGEGTRMKSKKPKVLINVLFKPMIKWVIDAVFESDIRDICVVTGFKHKILENYLSNLPFPCEKFFQKERKGTAHAVMTAIDFLKRRKDCDVLILSGDAPLLDSDTIKNAYFEHKKQKNSATIISAKINNPFSYGRIVRENGQVIKIVEQKDTDSKTSLINEVNSGAYWFNVKSLLSILPFIENNNLQKEYYLPDAIGLLLASGEKIDSYTARKSDVILGANDQSQLLILEQIAREKFLNKWIDFGTKMPCKDGITIGPDVQIEKDCTIFPDSIIYGLTKIGLNCKIGPNITFKNCSVGKNNILKCAHFENKIIKDSSPSQSFSTEETSLREIRC
jgi:bifunctional UDP-N-acetylglucosamine pyrophosphorylase/glucosamine-1-phosphate N-acetyltransferase